MPRLGQEVQKWIEELDKQLEGFFIPEDEKQRNQENREMSNALDDRDQKEWRAFMPPLNALLKDWDDTERKAGDASETQRLHLKEMYESLGIEKEIPERFTIEDFRDAVRTVWLSLKGYTQALKEGWPAEAGGYKDYYEHVFQASSYPEALEKHKLRKVDDYFLDDDGDRNIYTDEVINEPYRKKQLPASKKRLEEKLNVNSAYVIPVGAKGQQNAIKELLESYNHDFGLILRKPMEFVLEDYNTVVEDASAYTPDMYNSLKENYAKLTGISLEKAAERFPGEGSIEDFLVGANELWGFFNGFTEEHKDEKSFYFGSRKKYYEDVFASGFAGKRELLQAEQSAPEAIALRKKLADYLIPQDQAAQDAALAAMPKPLGELYVENPQYFLEKTKKVLADYNRIANAPAGEEDFKDEEHAKLYNSLYSLYRDVQLDNPDSNTAFEQFPKEARSRENYLQSVQKFYVYLKAATEAMDKAEDKKAVSFSTFREHVFQPLHFDMYYKALKQNAPQAAPQQAVPQQAAPQQAVPQQVAPQQEDAKEKWLLANLIPDQPENQQMQLEDMLQTMDKSSVAARDRVGFKASLRQCLKSYNEVLSDKKQPKKAELAEMFRQLYNTSSELGLTTEPSWIMAFQADARTPENFILNMQRVWVFLKGYSQACSEDPQYLDSPSKYMSDRFEPLDFFSNYKKLVADDIIGQVEEQQEKTPDKLADKLKMISENIPKFLQETQDVAKRSADTYERMKDAAGVDPRVTEPREVKENLTKLYELLEESAKQLSELAKRRKTLKKILDNQKKLGMLGLGKGAQYQQTTELFAQTDRLEKDWRASQAEAIITKRKLQGTDLQDAFISFEAAAAEKLKVSSGHAQEFGRIKETIAAYQKSDFSTEKQCAADLYRACREYLNAHTGDGVAQYEIGGQGTDTGRLRKQAVVKLLEVMEKKAESQPEFEAARESYRAYYKEHHNGKDCPELEINVLKASLARNSNAEVRAEFNENQNVVAGSSLIDRKAYAELEENKAKFLRKQQENARRQGERAARAQARAQRPRANAPRPQR